MNYLTRSQQRRQNWIVPRPIGIFIQDSYNNISYPIKILRIDNNKSNVGLIADQFFALYAPAAKETNILPWHYVIEFYQENYIAHNTRPLNLKYPKTIEETKEDAIENDSVILNSETEQLLNSTTAIENMISILLIGDSTQDMYTKKLYKSIASFVTTPTSRIGVFSPTEYVNVFFMNLGYQFKVNLLKKYIFV
jgi:hypothetical protein